MKITKIKCDRCGAEWTKDAPPDTNYGHELPDPKVEYSIFKYENLEKTSRLGTTIDLCEKCQKEFADWLSCKGGKSDELHEEKA